MAKIIFDEEFLSLLPSKWWLNFFKKFNQIETLPYHKWKTIHLLSYICYKYKEFYGKRFSFSLKGRPSSCQEIYLTKQVISVLGTDKPDMFCEYIDWVFEKKIKPYNKKIRSIGFFANSQFCNEFYLFFAEKNKISRTTEIPKEYKLIMDELELPIRTYGDLAFAKQVLDQDPNKELLNQMFNKLYSIGFEFKDLQGLV